MNFFSVSDIKGHYNDEKRKGDSKLPLYLRKIMRPLSFYVTGLFLSLKISANQASILGFCLAFIGCMLLASGNYPQMVVAFVLINFGILMDFVDGNIARYHDNPTYFGNFIDGLIGVAIYAMIPISLGFGVSKINPSKLILSISPTNAIIMGMSIAIIWLFRKYTITRYDKIYMKYRISEKNRVINVDKDKRDNNIKNKSNILFSKLFHYFVKVDGNIRIPALVLIIFKLPDVLLIIYTIIGFSTAILDIIRYIVRSRRDLKSTILS